MLRELELPAGADPTRTIEAYQQIVRVILGGRVLDPGGLAADRAE